MAIFIYFYILHFWKSQKVIGQTNINVLNVRIVFNTLV